MRDRFLVRASLAVITGILLSGPLAVVLLEWLAPQPPWRDVETFALHYRPLQGVPYLFGFVLLAGIATAVFGALVFVNYTIQLAWVPHAARAKSPLVEMFAYAALPVALWLVASFFERPVTRALFLLNLVASMGSAAIAAADPGWLLTPLGLVLYALWNVLLLAMMALVAVEKSGRSISGRMWGNLARE